MTVHLTTGPFVCPSAEYCARDMAIIKLGRDHGEHPAVVELTSVYHNLLRQWAEL